MIPREYAPGMMAANQLPAYDELSNLQWNGSTRDNPTPQAASTADGLIGLGVTALAALSLVQAGVPIPLVFTPLYRNGSRPR